jgi:predicted nucleic acid-binding protein
LLICDTSGLIAYFDAADPYHEAFAAAIDAERGRLIVSPYVIAELDHLLLTRRGLAAELAALAELAGGAWELPGVGVAGLRSIRGIVERYSDQGVGVTDASLAWLSGQYRTDRVLTLDRRHFEVLRTPAGGRFQILPE